MKTKNKPDGSGDWVHRATWIIDDSKGHLVVRDKMAVNDFNTEGITIETIDHELYAACNYGPEVPVAEQWALELIADSIAQQHEVIKNENAIIVDKNSGGKHILEPSDIINSILKERMCAPPLPHHLIQLGDDQRAIFLAKHPLALLRSVEHQDAVCRWLFASRCLPNGDARKNAQDLLDQSKVTNRRLHKHGSFRPEQLRQAYEDLKSYCDCWYACISGVDDATMVRNLFPDCDKLEPVITLVNVFPPKTKGGRTMSFIDVMHKFTKKPNPSEVAEQYINKSLDISPSTLHEIIGQA